MHNKRRAILLTVTDLATRDRILDKARALKQAGGKLRENLYQERCSPQHQDGVEEGKGS